MGAEHYGHVLELHPGETEDNRIVTELGYKLWYLFVVFTDQYCGIRSMGNVSGGDWEAIDNLDGSGVLKWCQR